MYGLILENLGECMKQLYGEKKWLEILKASGVKEPNFTLSRIYPETLLPKISRKCIQMLDISERQCMESMGVFFVGFVAQFGYDQVLSVLGRHFRDFINGLDNLHEYLKFSYPRMRPPSFFCEDETTKGMTLHYRSKRRGFVYYTMGQIKEVAKHYYKTEIKMEKVNEEIVLDTLHVTFHLEFENTAFMGSAVTLAEKEQFLPVKAELYFDIFPFCIVFGPDMVVRRVGQSLQTIIPDVLGVKLNEYFDLTRPLVDFKYDQIVKRMNNLFEMLTIEPISGEDENEMDLLEMTDLDNEEEREEIEKKLHLKGQMMVMEEWKMIMYLATPVMANLEQMMNTGLFINDLSMHDFSRDLILAGTQQSVEMKLALEQETKKQEQMEESMRALDAEMKRTDALLYQMIPQKVADHLRNGGNPIDTCKSLPSVTILFSDVVGFTTICSRITPMDVVNMLNAMYSVFDKLTEKNNVYKVETIGDAYMVVGGAPEESDKHAEQTCNMALDMMEAIIDLKDPGTGDHLRMRIGLHTGSVIAGVVGMKMPRYCLFGDTVNIASSMEAASEAMKIHITEPTMRLLPENFKIEHRDDNTELKGCESRKTFFLLENTERISLKKWKEENLQSDEGVPNYLTSDSNVTTERKDSTILSPRRASISSPVDAPLSAKKERARSKSVRQRTPQSVRSTSRPASVRISSTKSRETEKASTAQARPSTLQVIPSPEESTVEAVQAMQTAEQVEVPVRAEPGPSVQPTSGPSVTVPDTTAPAALTIPVAAQSPMTPDLSTTSFQVSQPVQSQPINLMQPNGVQSQFPSPINYTPAVAQAVPGSTQLIQLPPQLAIPYQSFPMYHAPPPQAQMPSLTVYPVTHIYGGNSPGQPGLDMSTFNQMSMEGRISESWQAKSRSAAPEPVHAAGEVCCTHMRHSKGKTGSHTCGLL